MTTTATLVRLSPAACSALASVATNRQGATPAPATGSDALSELTRLGLLGDRGGLTRKGTILRQLVMEEMFAALLG